MGKKIKFRRANRPINVDEINLLKSQIPYVLSDTFYVLLKESNGGKCVYDFKYFDVGLNHDSLNGFCVVFGVKDGHDNLIDEYNSPPEFFPGGLVAFSETGDGNRICFDYRNNPNTDDPPIVYWNHEFEEGKNVSFVAKNFEEFLSILKEPEDVEEISDEEIKKMIVEIRKRDPF